MAKETAEQKLLKALQKKSESPVSSTTKQPSAKKNFQFAFSIFDLNKILLIALIACFVILAMQVRSGMLLIKKDVDFSDEVKMPQRPQQATPAKPKDVKFYLDSFGNRNIFRPYDIALGKAAIGQPNLAKRLGKYKLVGVSWLDLPESASIMIEDTQNKTTHFLKTSEQLDGVTIKTIYTDRVVFSYENEEITIKL